MRIVFIFLFYIVVTSLGASSFWEFSGAVGESNQLVSRGKESGVFSTYFNPAAISFSKKGEQFGLVHIMHSTEIKLFDKPESSNITEDIFNARRKTSTGDAALIYRPLPTNMLSERGGAESADNITFLSFGMLREIIKDRLTFGFLALLPIKNMQVQTPFFNDEREQYFSNSLHFELYNDRFQSFSLSFALSLKITDYISLGAGGLASMNSYATSGVYIEDVSNQKISSMQPEIEVNTSLTPYFGLYYKPTESSSLSATVHFPYSNKVEATSEMIFFNFEDEDGSNRRSQTFKNRFNYEPLKISIGGEIKISNIGFTAQALYSNWSNYINRMGETPDDWRDTISFAGGVNFEIKSQLVGFDISYTPTAIPVQTGRYNYVDNDRLSTALSWRDSYSFDFGKLSLKLSAEIHYLIERENKKSINGGVIDEFPDSIDIKTGEDIESSYGFQSNNPGYPGFSSSGWIGVFSIMLSLES